MSEAEFRATLDPVAIIRNRASVGGPQPAEMDRMLKASQDRLTQQGEWVAARRARISSSLARLNADFAKLGSQ
jgi:argininosuccinate lyase